MSTKRTNETEPHVMYVKVSEYVKCYFTMKYGNPVYLPEASPLHAVMFTKLCENRTMKLLTEFSYSELAFNYDRDGKIFDIELAAPAKDEKDLFMSVVIPDQAIYGKRVVATNASWQLSKDGAVEFRKRSKREFWNAVNEFINECVTYAKARGECITTESAISDFMIAYDIPMEHFESLVRQERRMRTEYSKEIEKHRDFMESRCGRELLYT